MKDTKDLTFEEVEECRKLLKQMGEPVTPQNLAKELGVKKTDMMRFLLEGGYHFDMTEWTKHNKYYQVVKKWITVDKVFVNEIDNPRNPEWLPMMKAKYAKLIHLRKVEDYGYPLGWKLVVDPKGREGFGWRNTEEKLKAIEDAGLLKTATFCFGGFGDGWNEHYLGFKPEQKDEAVKALKDAGWEVEIEE